ncbi:MAG: nucleoside deaminase [Ectothiorhodospira sp.]
MELPPLEIRLPDWLEARMAHDLPPMPGIREQMTFAIALARDNVNQGTGGPFGAAVFDADGRLVAPGVNLVLHLNCALLHAEMVAMALAQRRLGRHDLSDGGRLQYTLVSSAEPCAMCLGAIPWSGVTRFVCGARDQDVRRIGFDEGTKPHPWTHGLTRRGIHVERDVLRDPAREVLRAYADSGGALY